MVNIRYFTNPLKTGDIYVHAQTVCTRPLLGGEGPGNEANSYYYLLFLPMKKPTAHIVQRFAFSFMVGV